MFTNESLEVISVPSSWKKSHQLTSYSKASQTPPLQIADAEAQAGNVSSHGTQTDAQDKLFEELAMGRDLTSELPRLTNFLRRVEGVVVEELAKNARSHAFDGYGVGWVDPNRTVTQVHSLQCRDARVRGLQVTSVSWNCTGSVIACAYGRVDDGDWSTERSCVCTWNLDRRSLNPEQPDTIIDVPSPVMSVCFHPQRPSLIAGGLYSGQVAVWDTGRSQDPLLAQTGMSPDAHRQPVYEVTWVPGARGGDLSVLSACSGGRVLRWDVDATQNKLTLSGGYVLVEEQLPHNAGSANSKVRSRMAVGVTALALSPWDPDTFLVGTEGGLVLKCSFSSRTAAAMPPDGESVALHAPARFRFSQRVGPVHSLHFSPFHRNLFVSVGTDGLAHVHSLLQPGPLLALRVSDSYAFGARWSPVRPLVFAVVNGQGALQVFDLGRRSLRPALVVEQETGGRAALCVEFNQGRLLAAGNADGTVNVWQLSAELTEARARESDALDQLERQLAE